MLPGWSYRWSCHSVSLMDRLSLQVISMTEFLSHGEAGIDMIPETPAIYVWTIDLTRLVRLQPNQASAELSRLIRLPTRTFQGRAVPYYTIGVSDVPLPMSADRSSKLVGALHQAGPVLRDVLLHATALQRPLYVGQAANLNTRFRSHIRIGSIFRGYLDEAGLRLPDCALGYIEMAHDWAAGMELANAGANGEDETDEGDGPWEAGYGELLDVLESLLHRLTRPLLARKIE